MSTLPEASALRLIAALGRPAPFTPFAVGDVIRYGQGSTALMQVSSLSVPHGPSAARYWGTQCLGGPVGANHEDCRAADAADLAQWTATGHYRSTEP